VTAVDDVDAPTSPEPERRGFLVKRPLVVTGRARPRVRRVTRVVRSVDPWSTFKVSLLFSLVLYLAVLLSAVLLWNVAHSTGTIDNVERFLESFGWESFTFEGGQLFRAFWVAGLFGVAALTGLAVLAATVFNLIADLVGGVQVTVLEEEVTVRTTDVPLPAPDVSVEEPS
jgi:hypothetical protein